MTINDVDQVYKIARIHDEYIVSHPFDGSGDTHGWVKGTVVDFEIDKDDDELDLVIELPWGETNSYGWSNDNIADGPLLKLCKAYGYSISDFERLKGEDIWLKVRYVELDDDGDISSGTRMKYSRAPTGPNYWKKWFEEATIVAIVVIVLLVIL